MKSRRSLLLPLASGLVALGLVTASALADELLGVLIKVDVAGKKVTVIEKETERELLISVTDETRYVTPKGAPKFDLEKVSRVVAKAQGKGRKGVGVAVTHDKAVASKIVVAAKKKDY
jgi:hypothetical protein